MSDLGEVEFLLVEADHGLPPQQHPQRQSTPQSQQAGLLDDVLHSQRRGEATPGSPSCHAVTNHEPLLSGWQVSRFAACVSPPA
jgi:hypothetical protein